MELHHVVEQCQSKDYRSGFSGSRINSTDNLMWLPKDVHADVSAYYSSRPRGFDETVRNSMNGMSFEDQYKFGMDVIRRVLGGGL